MGTRWHARSNWFYQGENSGVCRTCFSPSGDLNVLGDCPAGQTYRAVMHTVISMMLCGIFRVVWLRAWWTGRRVMWLRVKIVNIYQPQGYEWILIFVLRGLQLFLIIISVRERQWNGLVIPHTRGHVALPHQQSYPKHSTVIGVANWLALQCLCWSFRIYLIFHFCRNQADELREVKDRPFPLHPFDLGSLIVTVSPGGDIDLHSPFLAYRYYKGWKCPGTSASCPIGQMNNIAVLSTRCDCRLVTCEDQGDDDYVGCKPTWLPGTWACARTEVTSTFPVTLCVWGSSVLF